ncbi:four helix bundle protein [Parapedobacter sp. SGR-10]|nr:four helix bundle protein [Parapedobacter sp. SGR-10]
MHNFRKLQIWLEARLLAKEIHLLLKKFPESERFGMISQLRRCSISVPSNIAEGTSRSSTKAFYHFLEIALGSCFEMETQIILSQDFGYITEAEYADIVEKIIIQQKRITKFMGTLG